MPLDSSIDLTDNPFVLDLAEKDPRAQLLKEGAALAKSAAKADPGPNARSSTQVVPLSSLDTLTSKFDVTRIPLSRLKQMRRDPMIAFAMFFIHAQLARAKWSIKSTDAQQAAFAQNALAQVLPGLIAAYVEKLTYGYQPVVQRVGLDLPDWTYFDPADEMAPEKLVWNNGSVKATVLKPFISLAPETCDPIFTDAGDFDGIDYKPSLLIGGATGGSSEARTIDVSHSLWFTNEKASVHESLWGYPRIGPAYRFWWSFWFNWGLADRHFEKDADPAIKVSFPEGEGKDPVSGLTMQQVALKLGERARSNSVLALPSGLVMGDDGRPTSQRKWDVDFLKGGGNFEIFEKRFDQVQKFILRACLVPDEGFMGTGGGTAGYNKTGQLQDTFEMSQVVLMDDLDFAINRYVLPRLMVANFGDKAVKVTKVTSGFNSIDVDLGKSIIGSMANSDASQLELDVPALCEALGLPRLTPTEIQKKRAEMEAQAQAQLPTPQDAIPNEQAGITESGLYYNPRERIDLSQNTMRTDMDSLLLEDLMQVGSLRDPVVLSDARRLAQTWRQAIAADFTEATSLLSEYDISSLQLDEGFFERWTRRVTNRAQDTVATTRRSLAALMRRASTVELEKAGITDFSWDPLNDEAAARYLDERAADLVSGITETTKGEVRTYLADLVRQKTPKDQIPHLVRAHFSMFSQWRADRLVRTEFVNAYNRATLFAGIDAGVKQVQLIDGQFGRPRSDENCIERSGKVMSIIDALGLTEHPNGTLQFRLLRRNVKVKSLPVPKDRPMMGFAEDTLAQETVEPSTGDIVIWLADELDDARAEEFIEKVVDKVANMEASGIEIAQKHSGVMVALYPSRSVAASMAITGGLPASEIHLTLAFLGDSSEIGDTLLLQQKLEEFADNHAGLTGEVSGTGIFTAGPDPVTYASVDLPDLPAFREELVSLLDGTGYEVSKDHGYTPHMTLAYDSRKVQVENKRLTFPRISLVVGDERYDYDFGASS